jgi:predicted nucleic acid-binding Zn ribbon protein
MAFGAFAMKSGKKVSNLRHCLECGKPIIHRRITAVYCSGKCREVHNAKKRRLAHEDTEDVSPPLRKPQADE